MSAGPNPATFPIPRALLADGILYLRQAPDDTMAGCGVCQGDWVIVRHQDAAELGETVVARVGGEDVIRFVAGSSRGQELFAADLDIRPVLVSDAVITGRVVAVLRTL
jgi:repressor LexA